MSARGMELEKLRKKIEEVTKASREKYVAASGARIVHKEMPQGALIELTRAVLRMCWDVGDLLDNLMPLPKRVDPETVSEIERFVDSLESLVKAIGVADKST